MKILATLKIAPGVRCEPILIYNKGLVRHNFYSKREMLMEARVLSNAGLIRKMYCIREELINSVKITIPQEDKVSE